MEIPLCGHATLAASKVLFENDQDLKSIRFWNINQLEIKVLKVESGIQFEFPIYKTQAAEAPPSLLAALGLKKIINSVYNKETRILLLEIESSSTLRELRPDLVKLLKSHNEINGVLVTARSHMTKYDFESRYFWPWSGTNEDPVTGGTHTFLAPYWSERLQKDQMTSFQCSERTGIMEVTVTDTDTVIIKSDAVIVLEGELKL